jgi:hypothetical protein
MIANAPTWINLNSHPSKNGTPHFNRYITIKENMVDIFRLLEAKHTTPLMITCKDTFVEKSLSSW